MRLIEFIKMAEQEVRRKKRRIGRDKGNMHDDANRADYNHWGTHGMGKNGMSKSFSISPGEPGILLPGEADPTGGDGIPDRMTVRKR